METSPRTTVHLDATQLRALAHPLRMRLLGALRLHGPATATRLAEQLGTNSGKTSYHLRQLAEVGLVEEVPERGNARDRWWRAAHDSTSWDPSEFLDDPDTTTAADWLAGQVARTHARWTSDFVAARSEWPPEWIAASTLSDYSLRLRPDRLRRLNEEIGALIETYRDDSASDTADAERVTIVLHTFPHPEPTL